MEKELAQSLNCYERTKRKPPNKFCLYEAQTFLVFNKVRFYESVHDLPAAKFPGVTFLAGMYDSYAVYVSHTAVA